MLILLFVMLATVSLRYITFCSIYVPSVAVLKVAQLPQHPSSVGFFQIALNNLFSIKHLVVLGSPHGKTTVRGTNLEIYFSEA